MSSTVSRRSADRAAAAALALALQAGFIALFLHALPLMTPPKELAREITFILPPLVRTPPSKRPISAPRAASSAPVPVRPPLVTSPTSPNTPTVQGLQNFSRDLFGCAPESYANLTPDRKAHCMKPGEGMAIQQGPNPLGSPDHVKDEAHWEDEWARKQSPILLPCGGFLNLACLLGKIADGSLGDYGDPRKWPHYEVKQLAKGDFYKVEQAYDAWHKAHPQASSESVSVHAHGAEGGAGVDAGGGAAAGAIGHE